MSLVNQRSAQPLECCVRFAPTNASCHVINPAPGQTCLLFSLAARANRGIPSLCPPPFSTHTTSCIAAATTEVRSRRLGRNPRIDSTKQRAYETAVVSAKNGARFEDSATGGHAACKGRKGKTDAFDETLQAQKSTTHPFVLGRPEVKPPQERYRENWDISTHACADRQRHDPSLKFSWKGTIFPKQHAEYQPPKIRSRHTARPRADNDYHIASYQTKHTCSRPFTSAW